jgi:hypothetical protein
MQINEKEVRPYGFMKPRAGRSELIAMAKRSQQNNLTVTKSDEFATTVTITAAR